MTIGPRDRTALTTRRPPERRRPPPRSDPRSPSHRVEGADERRSSSSTGSSRCSSLLLRRNASNIGFCREATLSDRPAGQLGKRRWLGPFRNGGRACPQASRGTGVVHPRSRPPHDPGLARGVDHVPVPGNVSGRRRLAVPLANQSAGRTTRRIAFVALRRRARRRTERWTSSPEDSLGASGWPAKAIGGLPGPNVGSGARREPWLVLSPLFCAGARAGAGSVRAGSGLRQRPARASVGRWLWTRMLDACRCRGCEPGRMFRGFSWPARLARRALERLTQARLTGNIPIKWGPAGDVTGLARSPQRSRIARR